MNRRNILILTASHLCRNPRVVKEATALGTAGHDVTVLTISAQERFELIDRELIRDLPFRRLLLNYTAGTVGNRAADFLQRGATWLARHLCSEWGIETAQALGPASALLHRARGVPADLTILHTEIPIWAAQHLVRDGRRVAIDVEDWYSEDLLFADRQSRPIRLLRAAEKFALQHCAYASATSQSMADALVNAYGCPPPHVIRNTFPLQPRSRSHEPGPNATPRFIWFSQTIGPGRGLELFLPPGTAPGIRATSTCWEMNVRITGKRSCPACPRRDGPRCISFPWSHRTNSPTNWPNSISDWRSNPISPSIATSPLRTKSSST